MENRGWRVVELALREKVRGLNGTRTPVLDYDQTGTCRHHCFLIDPPTANLDVDSGSHLGWSQTQGFPQVPEVGEEPLRDTATVDDHDLGSASDLPQYPL
jgi:hypothetical protein